MWERAATGEEVIERDTGTDVEPFPNPVGERVEERDGPNEVGCEVIEEQAAFVESLPDEPEVELLEVAETPVNQLARSARGPGGEIPLLDQPHLHASGRGIERCTRAGDAATNDEHIEGFRLETLDIARPLCWVERTVHTSRLEIPRAAMTRVRSDECRYRDAR